MPNKNKGGAPKGNRNARKHGLYSNEIRALRLSVRHVIANAKLAAALARAEAALIDAQVAESLRSAGLTRRALWLSEW